MRERKKKNWWASQVYVWHPWLLCMRHRYTDEYWRCPKPLCTCVTTWHTKTKQFFSPPLLLRVWSKKLDLHHQIVLLSYIICIAYILQDFFKFGEYVVIIRQLAQSLIITSVYFFLFRLCPHFTWFHLTRFVLYAMFVFPPKNFALRQSLTLEFNSCSVLFFVQTLPSLYMVSSNAFRTL